MGYSLAREGSSEAGPRGSNIPEVADSNPSPRTGRDVDARKGPASRVTEFLRRSTSGLSTASRRGRPRPPGLPYKWRVFWGQGLPCDGGVYMRRWGAETPYGSVRLHHWVKSDDTRGLHDHPWPFVTCVLWGGYWDVTIADGRLRAQALRAGSVTHRRARHMHAVYVPPGGEAWTLVVTSSLERRWGFRPIELDGAKRFFLGDWKRSEKWFSKRGPHPCD
jgi:hypothetical protein